MGSTDNLALDDNEWGTYEETCGCSMGKRTFKGIAWLTKSHLRKRVTGGEASFWWPSPRTYYAMGENGEMIQLDPSATLGDAIIPHLDIIDYIVQSDHYKEINNPEPSQDAPCGEFVPERTEITHFKIPEEMQQVLKGRNPETYMKIKLGRFGAAFIALLVGFAICLSVYILVWA